MGPKNYTGLIGTDETELIGFSGESNNYETTIKGHQGFYIKGTSFSGVAG